MGGTGLNPLWEPLAGAGGFPLQILGARECLILPSQGAMLTLLLGPGRAKVTDAYGEEGEWVRVGFGCHLGSSPCCMFSRPGTLLPTHVAILVHNIDKGGQRERVGPGRGAPQ